MGAVFIKPFDGYPTSWGNQRACIVGHQGPASYTQLVPGVAPANATGGDTISAEQCGFKWIDGVIPLGLTDSGVYRVEAVPITPSGYVANGTRTPQPGQYYTLRWVVVATGAEAAALLDLDAEIVRLLVVGPK